MIKIIKLPKSLNFDFFKSVTKNNEINPVVHQMQMYISINILLTVL